MDYIEPIAKVAASAWGAYSQQEFQREMSSTAYQRAMADMSAAGLNPILAYQQGGASSPQGVNVGGAVASALQAAQVHLARSQARLLDAQARNTELAEPGLRNEAIIDNSAAGVPLRASARALSLLNPFKIFR